MCCRWGKLGQRPDQSRTEYVNNATDFPRLVFSGDKNIRDIRIVHDDMAAITYDHLVRQTYCY